MKKLTVRTVILSIMIGCLSVLSFATTAFAQEPDDPTLLELIQADPDLSTLATAISAANLADALSDPNASLTILAPTNDAFAELLDSDLQALLADPAELQSVLLYHVISGTLGFISDIGNQTSLTTLEGGEVKVGAIPNGTSPLPGFNDEAEIVRIDISAQNGVIHIIDGVLSPEATAVTLSNVSATMNSAMVIFIAVLSLAAVTPFVSRR